MEPFQVIDFHVVPSTNGAHQATLIWEKPLHAQAIFGYQLFLENDLIQTRPTNKTHWTLTNLSADQTYQVTIICLDHLSRSSGVPAYKYRSHDDLSYKEKKCCDRCYASTLPC